MTTKSPTHTMPISDVARMLGLSTDRVAQLDAELRPIRLPDGRRDRRYDPKVVERVARQRAARRP